MTRVAVIDIGKTNAKLALVDTVSTAELDVMTRPNRVLPGPPWPHFDLDGHWDFVRSALRAMQSRHGIDAIAVTTHGASVVLLDAANGLAAPMLDYEHDGPDALAAAYDAIRPGFGETGSPRLPMGLNAGAQLHYMFAADPGLRQRTATIVTYPQFWSYRLTGVAATEVTSLGCHTDLWDPYGARPSSLVAALGIAGKLAPLRPAAEVLGPVLARVAAETGLAPGTPVHCGIHDSNASLLPYLLGGTPPFSVVSTGTWVVVMSVGGGRVTLDPGRDTLVNVSAFGDPVPSARFMGGREHDLVSGGSASVPTEADLAGAIAADAMLLPAMVPESGPFRGRRGRWAGAEPAIGSGRRAAALGCYLGLMTAECLGLTGHRGPVIVEGPFARNPVYLAMLSAAADAVVRPSADGTGTSRGCALLAAAGVAGAGDSADIDRRGDPALGRYAQAWRERVAADGQG